MSFILAILAFFQNSTLILDVINEIVAFFQQFSA